MSDELFKGFVNIQEVPAWCAFDAELNPAGRQLWPKYNPKDAVTADAHFLTLHQKYYNEIFEGDNDVYSASKLFSVRWSDTFSGAPAHREWRRAWLRLREGNQPNPSSLAEVELFAILSTRRKRWETLAQRLGIQVPKGFRLFRVLKRRHFVDEVVTAWRDTDDVDFMYLTQHVLASWGMDAEALKSQIGKNEEYIVIHEAYVLFENTLADKWIDDGGFIVPWSSQKEVVVGIDQPDTMVVLRKKARVFWSHKEYTYENRQELIQAWGEA